MKNLTFGDLYRDRCDQEGKPIYWKPQPLPKVPYKYDDYGIPEVIPRILGSALYLEIDVREYIAETWRKKPDISKIAYDLMLSNIADESVHAFQFRKAIATYQVSDEIMKEANNISKEWHKAPGHPLEKAALLEIGVFVAGSLSVLLRCGGHALGWVAQMVGKDEQRHQATNRGILIKLGYDPFNPPAELEKLRRDTLDWMLSGFNIKHWGVSRDWIIKQSDSLVLNGVARDLSQWTAISKYRPPFEDENRFLGY